MSVAIDPIPFNIPRQRVGGLELVSMTRAEFAEQLLSDWRLQVDSGHALRPRVSFSVNGQVLAGAHRDAAVLRVLERADYLDADGMWIVFASRFFHRRPLPERIATTDFFHDCAQIAQRNGLSFFLLGGTEQNNADVERALEVLYPGLRIAGRRNGYFKADDWPSVVNSIRQARPDVVWIGMGFPRQEQLALDLACKLQGVTWLKTCGGLYEHLLGRHPRAPVWMQRCGLEWLHRTLREPRRLGWRYLSTNPLALWHLLTKTPRC